MNKIILDNKIFLYNKGGDSEYVMKECLIDEQYGFSWGIEKQDKVLNLGANIGAFDVYAYNKCHYICSYEPVHSSMEKLRTHLYINDIHNVEARELAVVGNDRAELTRVMMKSNLEGRSHITNEFNKDDTDLVDCITIGEVLDGNNFTKIKCDVEGAEYDIFIGLEIPESVNEIIIELHYFSDYMKEQAKQLINELMIQGFKGNVIDNDGGQGRTNLMFLKR